MGQKGAVKRSDPQAVPPTWLSALILDWDPTLANASIRDFQGGTTGYVANAVEQALLLPKDMTELRSMKRHKVFLNLKRYFTMVCLLLDPFFFSFSLIPLIAFPTFLF